MSRRSKTILTQESVLSIGHAEAAFNVPSHATHIPLVLIPWSSYLPIFTVPAGPFVLWQSAGQSKGQLTPGLKVGWAPWNSISHVVTKAAITYDAPTYDVPTADNVMVNVDISITFNIVEPSDFVYKIGANNFNEYLQGKIEEGVRGLVYGVTHNKVNDLREAFADSMRDNLKRALHIFGVNMMNVKVTNVKLPDELQRRLEKTTAFQTKIEEAQKHQETKKLLAENDALRKMEALNKVNDRKLQEIQAEINRFETETKEMCDKQRGLSAVQATRARASAEARIVAAKGNRDVVEAEGNRAAEEVIRSASIRADAAKIKADQDSMVMIKASQSRLLEAKNNAAGMIATAEAEAGAASKLKVKRAVELEKKRLTVLQKIAAKGRKIIHGKQSEKLMNQLVDCGVNEHAIK